jgi:hypothetical protein
LGFVLLFLFFCNAPLFLIFDIFVIRVCTIYTIMDYQNKESNFCSVEYTLDYIIEKDIE